MSPSTPFCEIVSGRHTASGVCGLTHCTRPSAITPGCGRSTDKCTSGSPGSVRRLDDRAPTPWSFQTWALGNEGGLVYLDQVPGCLSMLSEIGVADGQVPKKRCLVADRLASTNGFSLDSRTQSMYLSLTVEDGTDIAFMPLPPEPRTLVPGWFK